ncbi:MAG: pitrilysin family protein, partial [Chloroflexota bacterium]
MNQSYSLPGPANVSRTTLANGITILVRNNPNSPSASLSGYLTTGSLFDSDEKLGRSTFATASLMRGTKTRTFDQIYDALESVGASFGFAAGTHTTGFNGRCLAEDLPLLFDLLANSLLQPTFPVDEVEKLRNQLMTGLALRAQDTGEMAALTFDQLIYQDHPYGRPDDGYPETIRRISRDDLFEFHDSTFSPIGMTLAVVGAVEPDAVIRFVEQFLGDWQKIPPSAPDLPVIGPLQKTTRKHIPLAGKSQTDLMVGVLGPCRKDPEYMAASLGNSVLGQFGMMGRIGDIVREQSGLAYYASSNLSAGTGPGTWEVSAGVNPSNLDKALKLITKEIDRLTKDGVSPEELLDSQDHYVGRLPLSMESNAGIASALMNIERHNLGLDYYLRYEELVRSVT